MPWNRRELLRTGLSGASLGLLKTSDNLSAAAGLNMGAFAAGTGAAQITPTRKELDEMGGGFSSGPLFQAGRQFRFGLKRLLREKATRRFC